MGPMLGLTPGELVVVTFVSVAVITASWWPRAGAAVAELLSSSRSPAEGSVPDSERGPAGGDNPAGGAPLTGPGRRDT